MSIRGVAFLAYRFRSKAGEKFSRWHIRNISHSYRAGGG
jgi:hypothetical protein